MGLYRVLPSFFCFFFWVPSRNRPEEGRTRQASGRSIVRRRRPPQKSTSTPPPPPPPRPPAPPPCPTLAAAILFPWTLQPRRKRVITRTNTSSLPAFTGWSIFFLHLLLLLLLHLFLLLYLRLYRLLLVLGVFVVEWPGNMATLFCFCFLFCSLRRRFLPNPIFDQNIGALFFLLLLVKLSSKSKQVPCRARSKAVEEKPSKKLGKIDEKWISPYRAKCMSMFGH